MERLDECLKVHADMLDAQNIGSIYELQGLSELHYYLKVEHVFTPAEVEALLSFQDPLDVARWCWEENNHEHSFPICDLLKEIDAEQKFEHFTSEASAQDKYTLLMKRLGQNYFAYRESLMSRDKESLIEKAAEITAMQEAYSYLTTKFEFGDEMLDDVLALENPLKYFADRWLLPVSDVFAYPGIGALSYESARYHDYNLLMLLCMMSGILVIFCNIVSQTINEQIDPRMKDEVITEKSEVVEG